MKDSIFNHPPATSDLSESSGSLCDPMKLVIENANKFNKMLREAKDQRERDALCRQADLASRAFIRSIGLSTENAESSRTAND